MSQETPRPKLEVYCEQCDDIHIIEGVRLEDKIRCECPRCYKTWITPLAGAIRQGCSCCTQEDCGASSLVINGVRHLPDEDLLNQDILIETLWIPHGFERAVAWIFGVTSPLASAEHLPLWLVEECLEIHARESDLRQAEDSSGDLQEAIDDAMKRIAEELGEPVFEEN